MGGAAMNLIGMNNNNMMNFNKIPNLVLPFYLHATIIKGPNHSKSNGSWTLISSTKTPNMSSRNR